MRKRLLDQCCWIFDLDGTLTRPIHDFDKIREQLNVPRNTTILEYYQTLPEPQAAKLMCQLDEIEYQLALQSELSEGAADLLEYLYSRGCKLGILTRNNKHNAIVSLQKIKLLNYFDENCIVGREEANPKPAPDGVYYIIRNLGVKSTQSIMVGDYLFDLQTAKNAGIMSVHVDSLETFLWSELADVKVRSLSQLLNIMLS